MRLPATMLLSTLILTLLTTGCASTQKTIEIPSDRWVVTVNAGVPFTPPCDGKFVPEARFKEMLDIYVKAGFKH